MIISFSGQSMIFFMTVFFGIVMGVLYDLIRVIRRIIPHAGFFVQAEDLIYCASMALLVFYVMLNRNYGEVRFFSILGIIIGLVLYYSTVSKPILNGLVAMLRFFIKVIKAAISILLFPIKMLYRIIRTPVRFLKKKFLAILRKTKKALKKINTYAKMRASRSIIDFKHIFKTK